MVKENGLFWLSTGLLLEIARRKVCVLSVILFSIAVVKLHQRVTFILLSDVHLGKSHLSCCCKVGKLLILRGPQREMLEFPLEPCPSPTAFQWMSKTKRCKAGGAGAQLLMLCFLWMCSVKCQAGFNASQSPRTAPAGLQGNFHCPKKGSEGDVSETLEENPSVENDINDQQTHVCSHMAIPTPLPGERTLALGDLLKIPLLFRAVPQHYESLQGSRLCADFPHDRCCRAYTHFISSLGCKETQTFYWPSGRENNFLSKTKWFILVLSLKLWAW